jgi:hypothetical protein
MSVHRNEAGEPQPACIGIRKLAARAHASKQGAINAIRALEKKRHISVERRRTPGRKEADVNLYRVHIQSEVVNGVDHLEVVNGVDRVVHAKPGGGQRNPREVVHHVERNHGESQSNQGLATPSERREAQSQPQPRFVTHEQLAEGMATLEACLGGFGRPPTGAGETSDRRRPRT